MPILSNSMVTRPLTDAEIDACNFRTTQVLTDTRTLRFYYRFLPDRRLQIGSRSAITGDDAPNPRHFELLKDGMARKPALRGVEIDYSWWGWVDVSHDMMPRVCQPDPRQSVYYALGYGGNGVSYSQQAAAGWPSRSREGRTADAADLHVAAAWPPVRAVPAPRATDALPVLLQERRKALNVVHIARRDTTRAGLSNTIKAIEIRAAGAAGAPARRRRRRPRSPDGGVRAASGQLDMEKTCNPRIRVT